MARRDAMTDHGGTISIDTASVERLVTEVFRRNGCDEANTAALTRTIVAAERDGAKSHGLFRVPGYVVSLRSGKVNGKALPAVTADGPSVIRVDGDRGFAPLALEQGIPVLAEAAMNNGVAVMSLTDTHHFAALWHEVEALTTRDLAAIACVSYAAVVAPHGGKEPIFGTNPIAFAWPRPGRTPVVFDMATAAMAQGEIQLAAEQGRAVPFGTGLGPDGMPSSDPNEVLEGVQLPFGGHKGSALALMVELLACGATGECFSPEASAGVEDGGPPRGGELIIALAPEKIAGRDWAAHCERYFERFEAIEGARLPGSRRHRRRADTTACEVSAELLASIRGL